MLIGQGSPTDWKAMKNHTIGHGALIINAQMYKSLSIINSSFPVMLSFGESLGTHHNHWPETEGNNQTTDCIYDLADDKLLVDRYCTNHI